VQGTAQVAALLGLYLIAFLAAVVTARLFKSSVLKSAQAPFLLEMPSYRWPTVQSLGLRLLDRGKVFLRRAGTIILLVTVVLWVMAHVPYTGGKEPIEHSLAGTMGRTIEPLIKPLGFNWKIGIGLITSLAARETIISTLGTIYGMDPDSQGVDLQKALRQDSDARRRRRAAHLLRLRHAVHVDGGGSAPRNRRMEVAHPAIRLHGRAGLCGGIHRFPRDRVKGWRAMAEHISVSGVSWE
jgi:Fe2+ transport system protein B